MSNLEPKPLSAAQKLARLRQAARRNVDVRKAPLTATDLHQVQRFGSPSQKAAAHALAAQAARRHGA